MLFSLCDIIEFENDYYGLIVEVVYVNESIFLKVLNIWGSVRQLNLMVSGSGDYSYSVINV